MNPLPLPTPAEHTGCQPAPGAGMSKAHGSKGRGVSGMPDPEGDMGVVQGGVDAAAQTTGQSQEFLNLMLGAL
ncbi:MAG: hypothetical protein KC462_06745, partial [Cyanobacteria bacterium HKST-UBA05]|nr:hypothetical protein [Cyanobacteria bacterium HKST-UBA05]